MPEFSNYSLISRSVEAVIWGSQGLNSELLRLRRGCVLKSGSGSALESFVIYVVCLNPFLEGYLIIQFSLQINTFAYLPVCSLAKNSAQIRENDNLQLEPRKMRQNLMFKGYLIEVKRKNRKP